MRILCVRDLANGDHLIVSTALTSAQTERKLVVIVGIDTDLLVILISQSSSEICIRDTKQHLKFVHAMCGCDTLSAPCVKDKTVEVC